MQAARQLLSGGQFLSQLNGNQTIEIQRVIGPDVDESTEYNDKENDVSEIATASTIQTDAEAIVKVLEVRDIVILKPNLHHKCDYFVG